MMATQSYPLDFTRGVNEYDEATSLPDGYGVTLRNWIPEANGSLRVPRGWVNTSETSLTGTRTGRGIQQFVTSGTARIMVAQASSGTQYKLWELAKASLAAGTWTLRDTVTANPSTRPLAMASGLGKILYCTPEFPSSLIRYWDGSTTSTVSSDAIAGRALVYHNNRFFVGGATTNPTYLRWSELSDETSWETATNFQPISDDDGEPIEDLASWDRLLFIGKESSIWVQSGFGPTTFAWRKLDGGGVAPGRTLIPTPQGIVAAGRERVWMFEGAGFEPISQPIETSYGMTGNYLTGAYIDGVCYICDENAGTIFRYDLARRAWSIQDVDDTDEGPNGVAAISQYLFATASDATENSILLYREEPGGSRAMPANTGLTFTAKSGELWFGGSERPATLSQLNLRLRQRSGDATESPIQVNLYEDGTLVDGFPVDVDLADSASVYRTRVPLGHKGRYGVQVELTQTIESTEDTLTDIEEAVLEVEIHERR